MDSIDGERPGRTRRLSGKRLKGSAVLAAAALGAGGGSLAVAAIADAGSSARTSTTTTRTTEPDGRGRWFAAGRPSAFGTVKSVGADSFTLTTPVAGTVTVDVSGATRYRERGQSSASLANVTVGEHVAVVGTDTSGTVAATDVFIGRPGGFHGRFDGPGGWFAAGRPSAFGTVKSVGADSFTLTTPVAGTVTVDVSGATRYRERGQSSASLANVTVGEHVAVVGTDTSGTVAATDVFIGRPGGFHGRFDGPGGWGGPDGPGGPGGRGGW